jgi:hypothetical protein
LHDTLAYRLFDGLLDAEIVHPAGQVGTVVDLDNDLPRGGQLSHSSLP